MRPCPTCKSERCGNHAACERKAAKQRADEAVALEARRRENIIFLRSEIGKTIEEIEQRRGYPMGIIEQQMFTFDFMSALNKKLANEKKEPTP